MKKIIFAIAIVLTMGLSVSAQSDGFFRTGDDGYTNRGWGSGENPGIVVPGGNAPGTSDGDSPGAPLGTGLLIMTALGAGYAVAKRRKK